MRWLLLFVCAFLLSPLAAWAAGSASSCVYDSGAGETVVTYPDPLGNHDITYRVAGDRSSECTSFIDNTYGFACPVTINSITPDQTIFGGEVINGAMRSDDIGNTNAMGAGPWVGEVGTQGFSQRGTDSYQDNVNLEITYGLPLTVPCVEAPDAIVKTADATAGPCLYTDGDACPGHAGVLFVLDSVPADIANTFSPGYIKGSTPTADLKTWSDLDFSDISRLAISDIDAGDRITFAQVERRYQELQLEAVRNFKGRRFHPLSAFGDFSYHGAIGSTNATAMYRFMFDDFDPESNATHRAALVHYIQLGLQMVYAYSNGFVWGDHGGGRLPPALWATKMFNDAGMIATMSSQHGEAEYTRLQVGVGGRGLWGTDCDLDDYFSQSLSGAGPNYQCGDELGLIDGPEEYIFCCYHGHMVAGPLAIVLANAQSLLVLPELVDYGWRRFSFGTWSEPDVCTAPSAGGGSTGTHTCVQAGAPFRAFDDNFGAVHGDNANRMLAHEGEWPDFKEAVKSAFYACAVPGESGSPACAGLNEGLAATSPTISINSVSAGYVSPDGNETRLVLAGQDWWINATQSGCAEDIQVDCNGDGTWGDEVVCSATQCTCDITPVGAYVPQVRTSAVCDPVQDVAVSPWTVEVIPPPTWVKGSRDGGTETTWQLSDGRLKVWVGNGSGELQGISPDGFMLPIFSPFSGEWFIYDTRVGDSSLDTAHFTATLGGSANNKIQWTADNHIFRVNGTNLEKWDPVARAVVNTVAYTPPGPIAGFDVGDIIYERGGGFEGTAGDASDTKMAFSYVMALDNQGLNGKVCDQMGAAEYPTPGDPRNKDNFSSIDVFSIGILDVPTWTVDQNPVPFDSNVWGTLFGGQGCPRYHGCYIDDSTLWCIVGDWGPNTDDPHYTLGLDLTSMTQRSNVPGGNGVHAMDMSHTTVENGWVAFFQDDNIFVGDYVTGDVKATYAVPPEVAAPVYRQGLHGTLLADAITGAANSRTFIHSRFNPATQIEDAIMLWPDVLVGEGFEIAGPNVGPTFDTAASGGDVAMRATPIMNTDGTQAIWVERLEQVEGGGSRVVIMDYNSIAQITATPSAPDDTQDFDLSGVELGCVCDANSFVGECDGDFDFNDTTAGALPRTCPAPHAPGTPAVGLQCSGGTCGAITPEGTISLTIASSATPDPPLGVGATITLEGTIDTVADASACTTTLWDVDPGTGTFDYDDTNGVVTLGPYSTSGAKQIRRRAEDGDCIGEIAIAGLNVQTPTVTVPTCGEVGGPYTSPCTVPEGDPIDLTGIVVTGCTPAGVSAYGLECGDDFDFNDVVGSALPLSCPGTLAAGVHQIGIQAQNGTCGAMTPNNLTNVTVEAAVPTETLNVSVQGVNADIDTNDFLSITAYMTGWDFSAPVTCDFECTGDGLNDDGSRIVSTSGSIPRQSTFFCNGAGGVEGSLTLGDYSLGAECSDGVTTLSDYKTISIVQAETAIVTPLTTPPILDTNTYDLRCTGIGFTGTPDIYAYDCDNGSNPDEGFGPADIHTCAPRAANTYATSCSARRNNATGDEWAISPTMDVEIIESQTGETLTNLIVTPNPPLAGEGFNLSATPSCTTGTTWEADCDTDPDFETPCVGAVCTCAGRAAGLLDVGLRLSGGDCSPSNPTITQQIQIANPPSEEVGIGTSGLSSREYRVGPVSH